MDASQTASAVSDSGGKQRIKWSNWLKKTDIYADDLADMFGGILVISVGAAFVALIGFTYHYVAIGWTIGIILSAIVVGVFSLWLMVYFAKKVYREEECIDKNPQYVISGWRISTLKAAGVPEDLIYCLINILAENSVNKPAANQKLSDVIDDAIIELKSSDSKKQFTRKEVVSKLKEKVGKTRVDEFKEVILRYTAEGNES